MEVPHELPLPCWASQDEALHARAEGKLEDEAEHWSREATAKLRSQLEPAPGETWFSESIRGPRGFYSQYEVLSEIIGQGDPALTKAYSDLMRSDAAKEVRELMHNIWDCLHNDANAAWLKLTRRRQGGIA